MDKYSPIQKIEIKLTGSGGVVGVYADKLYRDLKKLGYPVSLMDPVTEENAYWSKRVLDSQKAIDEHFDPGDIREMRITVEHVPWGG